MFLAQQRLRVASIKGIEISNKLWCRRRLENIIKIGEATKEKLEATKVKQEGEEEGREVAKNDTSISLKKN